MELNKAKQQIKEADTAIGSQKAEIEKLNHIINEADQERIRQKKEYDIVVNERDILGTQVCAVVLCVSDCVYCVYDCAASRSAASKDLVGFQAVLAC